MLGNLLVVKQTTYPTTTAEAYFTQQVDELVKLKSATLFSPFKYDNLTQAEKDLVWDSVKEVQTNFPT